ncbi:ligase-associated DNA damage response exonuclease [Alteromonas ponticola]|uniref:Ligase-associated DNA damage response exonuclease n=1 Tax=Alteromonas aquimaris TaxID=2998417 RepID=A0ABT3P8T7_9ALTE|nr:ligase-associated DNA damage response exonuclease [Alteromonas aquimaris]MCW8109193.1 ligase-associated DNA damage response exonuclease [Alteromonas aquimaris]
MSVESPGLYCKPADIYIDPMQPVAQAIVTHGHADHARSGHDTVYASDDTIAIMHTRYGEEMAKNTHGLAMGEIKQFGKKDDPVLISLHPAGHILGSCQVRIEYRHQVLVISGDYKRRPDPTCDLFEILPCDVFITEATFALPVFRHPPIEHEIAKLLSSVAVFPDRCHLIGAYALGKCQRVILGLRNAGYSKPIYLHGALIKLCNLYQSRGIDLGELLPVSDVDDKKLLAGEIVIAPPSALADRWSRSLPKLRTVMASGWMQIRARARQRLVELPLIISDHCDWPELLQTIEEVNPQEVWVTHGREDALVHQSTKMGYTTKALRLIGYDDEDETG